MKKNIGLKLFSALMAAMMIFSFAYTAPITDIPSFAIQASAAKAVNLSKCKITYATSKVYTGSYIKPTVKVTYGNKTLKAGKHYTVAYSNNKNVGTAKITITAVKGGGYTGKKTVSFKILSKTGKLSNCEITYPETKVYTGKYIKPTVKVTYGGKTLKAGRDYTVKYSNNRKVGTAKITITAVSGSGYSGTRNVKFKILPKTVFSIKAENTTSTSTFLSWSTIPLATGYAIFSYNTSTKEYTRLATSKTNYITLKNLKPGTIYRFSIRAFTYNEDEDRYYRADYSYLLRVVTKPSAAPKIAVSYPSADSVKLSWNPVKGASGYYVYAYHPEYGYRLKIADAGNKTNYTLTGLDSGTYGFSIAAYKTDGTNTLVGELAPTTNAKINTGLFRIQKYARMTAMRNYQMTFKTNVAELSGKTYTFAEKNNYVSVQTTVDNVKARVLYDRKSRLSYAVIEGKTYLLPLSGLFNVEDLSGTFQFPSSGLTPILEPVDNKLCYVNAIRGSDGNYRKFYFDSNGDIIKIAIVAADNTTVFYISEFKSPADQSLFDLDISSLSPLGSLVYNIFGK